MSAFLGIDLGTSSIKVLRLDENGSQTWSCRYDTPTPDGWWQALCRTLASLPPELTKVDGIGLSSQVGTYLYDGQVLSWQSPAGSEEVRELVTALDEKAWREEIGMIHPLISSYPAPRLRWLHKQGVALSSVCQPKEDLCRRLTGQICSDRWSWRGLYHPVKEQYSEFLLRWSGYDRTILPPVLREDALAGTVTLAAAHDTGLQEGTPVYVGCNDFYAALFGMGVLDNGTMFDLTGTSEHIGIKTATPSPDGQAVCSPYADGFVTYGVTASSGASFDFALRELTLKELPTSFVPQPDTPLFLPYLKGERAPIWDAQARGVFFGIGAKTTKQDLCYAVLEGVAFSVCHIARTLPQTGERMYCAGGSAKDPLLCRLKATIIGKPVLSLAEENASALGAALLAGVGGGAYNDLHQAAGAAKVAFTSLPDPALSPLLEKRFALYKKLYPSLKENFAEFSAWTE